MEDPGVDGRILLKWIFKEPDVKSMDWLHLAQDRDTYQALANAVMKVRLHKMGGWYVK